MYFKIRKYGKHEIVYWTGKRWGTKPLDSEDDSWVIFDFSFDSERLKIDFIEQNVLFVDQKPIPCSVVWLSDGTKIVTPTNWKTLWTRWEKHLKGEEEEEG